VSPHSSPEQLIALAGGSLPYLCVREVVLHVRECPECQSVFAEARECLLIEAELRRDPINAMDLTAIDR
jgi:anti-sigma factor ChrR (cupin superfamily)